MSNGSNDLKEEFDNALHLYQKNKIHDAIKALKDMLRTARGEMRIKVLDLLAKICVDKDILDKAIDIYLKALKHVTPENWAEYANLYNKLGLLYQACKNLDEALKYQQLCLEMLEKDGNKPFQAITYRNLGRIFTLIKDHVNALRAHQKSLELKRVIGDKSGEAQTYETMAQDAEFEENFDDAMENYKKAFEIYQELGQKDEIERINAAIETLKASKEALTEFDEENMYLFKTRNLF